ncbi:MAG: response regulator [Chlorobi bacterium]|nr:response regulator [Chlorobiota bacterium]
MLQKPAVLIVEDDTFSVILLKEYLSTFDIEIQTAGNGKEAVSFCENNKPDIVITDILMPFMDGIILMKEIKKKNPRIKFIAETAYSTTEKLEEITNAGFEAIIIKPYNKEDFQKIFKDVLKTINPGDFT